MPIQVRYGPTGLALQAAQQAGEGQDFWRRHAAGQQLISSARQREARQNQQRLRAMELQNVYRQQQAPRQTIPTQAQIIQGGPSLADRARQQPTAGPTRRRDTPLTRAVAPSPLVDQTGGEGYIETDGLERFDISRGGGVRQSFGGIEVPFDERQRGFVQGRAPEQPADPQVVQQVRDNISLLRSFDLTGVSAQQRQALQQLAQSPNVDPTDLRLAASQAVKSVDEVEQGGEQPARLSPHSRAQQQIASVNNKIKRIRQSSDISVVEEDLSVEEFAEQRRQGAREGAKQIDRSSNPFSYGLGGMSKQENLRQRLEQAENDIANFRALKDLQKAREKIVNPQQETKNTLTAEQASQFLRRAGGDKDAARRMAREAGYSF